jgi:hypothetical protein
MRRRRMNQSQSSSSKEGMKISQRRQQATATFLHPRLRYKYEFRLVGFKCHTKLAMVICELRHGFPPISMASMWRSMCVDLGSVWIGAVGGGDVCVVDLFVCVLSL